MRSRLWFCLLFSALVLSLGGCDSVDLSDQEEALVDGWAFQRETTETYLTVDETQTIINPMQPGEGRLAMTGGVTDTLVYLRTGFLPDITTRALFMATNVPVSAQGRASHIGETPVRLLMALGDSRDASLLIGSLRDPEGYAMAESAQFTFDQENHTATFNNVPFIGNQDTAFVDGSLRGAMLTLPAGESTLASTLTSAVPSLSAGFTFEEDGDFTSFVPQDNLLIPRPGTWRLDGDELVLDFGEDEAQEMRLTYQIEGETLQIEANQTCVDAESIEVCRALDEFNFGVQQGTLLDVRRSLSGEYERTDG